MARLPPTWAVGALIAALGIGVVVAGCAAPAEPGPGSIAVTAAWQPWHDDPLPHLMLQLTNTGESSVAVGPGGEDVAVTGPSGMVPIYWGETPFARPIHAGRSVSVGFHPREPPNGTFGLAIDHAWGIPATPPPGLYTVCVGADCVPARLE